MKQDNRRLFYRSFAIALIAFSCFTVAAIAGNAPRDFTQPGSYAPPASFNPNVPIPDPNGDILAGHLLRRIGFGPNAKDMKAVKKFGLNINAYIDKQLNPNSIGDSKALKKMPKVPSDFYDDYTLIRRWYIRMTYTKRLLNEKMTLIWHEHFATSNDKVGVAGFMGDQEELFRANALGNFRDLLVKVSKDQAMLIWLDNNYNDGTDVDNPPNENYAREFLQLFSMGTRLLNLDGTYMVDGGGDPIPAYTETDIRQVAHAITGWYVDYPFKHNNTQFGCWIHDSGDKVVFGQTITGQANGTCDDNASELAGQHEIEDVVDLVLSGGSNADGHKQDRINTVAAFIAKQLIQKLATENPSQQYVTDVATAFRDSNWDIKTAVSTLLKHPEFQSAANMRTMYKEPIEQLVGMVRGLDGVTKGNAILNWSYDANQLLYYPPSVFSFYPPGNRGALINTALVWVRDEASDDFANRDFKDATHDDYWDTAFDAAKLMKKNKLKTPESAVLFLEERLLAAPMSPDVRTEILTYIGATLDETKFRGAVWLFLCSPDFQRN